VIALRALSAGGGGSEAKLSNLKGKRLEIGRFLFKIKPGRP